MNDAVDPKILQEIKEDIDSDGVIERVVVDSEPVDYVRLLIYKGIGDSSKILFNSENNGSKYEIEFLRDNKNKLLKIEDNDKNGIPEIYFTEFSDGIQPDKLVIIDRVDDIYTEVFHSYLVDPKYIDLNGDGAFELCGCSEWGSQVMFNGAEFSAFERKKTGYIYSTELTKRYNLVLCADAEAGFKAEPNSTNLEYLISRYAKSGLRDKGIDAIKKNFRILSGGDDQIDISVFIDAFEQRLKENGFAENDPAIGDIKLKTVNMKDLVSTGFSGGLATITLKQNMQAFDCPIPERIAKAAKKYVKSEDLFSFEKLSSSTNEADLGKNQANEIYSLRIKYGEVEYISGDIENKYVDIAKIQLNYSDVNNLQLNGIRVLPKYTGNDNSQEGFKLSEASFGEAHLFDTFKNLLELLGKDKDKYNADIEGHFVIDNLDISFTNYRISGLIITTSDYKTVRGLKVGDDKIKAQMLYDLPDEGFFEDDRWSFYFYRDWLDDGTSDILSEDFFRIIFKNNIVESIELEGYIPYD